MAEHVDTFYLNEIIWKGVTITDKAADQIRKLIKKNPDSDGLSINIKQSGCAGFSYVIEFIDNPTDEYLLFENNGAKIFVLIKSMPFIDGTEVDYVREGLNQVFKFNNPKAQHACGCGESFSI
ncbi:Iron-binding protein IscA [Arsenophonus endosymbiont of Aleurodicus dispersus]|uniref:Fe-S cluster assembly scaffold SufA n=1 Tax=Arsenophonus endosymbiont of Aleurodicus dispersus TaxID=235559 RepID=UPI000EADE597|nr:Fe-S cluster assembly scaffold SufA [Arsenophonus endosymbiont of Aleurodicus dispersus]VAY02290.1 Iron-binding protein IscA [Arsenophonus endosymbiont of Aleurodicus dispersus]